ncbi:hypothetical protein JX83_18770 [Salmonella enterica]|nr:hypothetical protein [Salmonella enterica]
MAFCCKSDGGQHQGKLPPPIATQYRSYGRFITVLRRDWVVVAGADLRLNGDRRVESPRFTSCPIYHPPRHRINICGLASPGSRSCQLV